MIRQEVIERTFSIKLTSEQFEEIDRKVYSSFKNVCNIKVGKLISRYRNEINKLRGN